MIGLCIKAVGVMVSAVSHKRRSCQGEARIGWDKLLVCSVCGVWAGSSSHARLRNDALDEMFPSVRHRKNIAPDHRRLLP